MVEWREGGVVEGLLRREDRVVEHGGWKMNYSGGQSGSAREG